VGELLALIWYEKALPSVPLAVVALVITGAGMAMVSVKVALPVPVLFIALSVTVELPAAVGAPEINPVVLLTVSPAGKPVAP
jgi:hydrogenase/urease accessory protein HupE